MLKQAMASRYYVYFLLLSSGLVSQENSTRSFIVRTEHGFIDYSNRIIICRGTANIIEKNPVDDTFNLIEKNLRLAKGQARTQARKNLVEIVKKVNFDGRFVEDLITNEPLIQNRVESLIGSAYQQGEIEYLEKNKVAIALAVRMSGLAEILVNVEGYRSEDGTVPAYLMTRATIPKSERISGVVIDAREHSVDPSMNPEIIDMQGNLVYGTLHYTRSRSVNTGPVGYAYSMDDKNVGQRVGGNPIIIEAVGFLDDDVYITSMDAEMVRDAEKNFGILSDCRVMFLMQ